MAKINLKASIISEDENITINTSGIRNKNKIIYKENNITVTLLILDNRIEMNRSCDEYKIDLIFDKNKDTISEYSLSLLKKFELETITKNIVISKDLIKIDYYLEGNKFKYILEMEDL